jgi:hypothetical protein
MPTKANLWPEVILMTGIWYFLATLARDSKSSGVNIPTGVLGTIAYVCLSRCRIAPFGWSAIFFLLYLTIEFLKNIGLNFINLELLSVLGTKRTQLNERIIGPALISGLLANHNPCLTAK